MATVNALGTNFNLPNYHGRLHLLTRADTPFLTALMGTSDGGQAVMDPKARTFEWQTVDLRSRGQNTVVDGDSAGTPEHRSRSNVFNVLQTHREDVGVAYERQAQTGQFDGQNIAGDNPVNDELAFQINLMWKQIKNDMNYSAINGTYDLPSSNATPAKTRGILEAISTNVVDAAADNGKDATGETIDDLIDLSAHGYSDGQDVFFSSLTGGANLAVDTRYYVVNATTNTFQLASTKGGAALDFGSDITASVIHAYATPTEETIDDVMQSASDNGGLEESEMGLILVGSSLLRWITKIYIKDKGLETRSRNVGGASVNTVITPFGELGLMYERDMPDGTLATVSLDQCKPHFRVIPNKGVSFAEQIGKDGASDKFQLYTSFGLEYGSEAAHGKVTNLTVNSPTAA